MWRCSRPTPSATTTPISGLAGLLIVRGSAPNGTGYYVDGGDVPLIYHFGGLSSVVPTELLDRIDFYPGNFSARYGRVMGGIVDVALLSPNTECYDDADLGPGRPADRARFGPERHRLLRRRRRRAADLSLRRTVERRAHGAARPHRLLPGQLQRSLRPRDGRHRRCGAALAQHRVLRRRRSRAWPAC